MAKLTSNISIVLRPCIPFEASTRDSPNTTCCRHGQYNPAYAQEGAYHRHFSATMSYSEPSDITKTATCLAALRPHPIICLIQNEIRYHSGVEKMGCCGYEGNRDKRLGLSSFLRAPHGSATTCRGIILVIVRNLTDFASFSVILPIVG